jgi:hypothetical protein
MPKTKKQSKAKGLRSTINLSSNKGKLIAFMLVFAVIGGGYMLYRSFAATTPALVYTQRSASGSGSSYLTNQVLSKINADGTGNSTIVAGSWYSEAASGTIYSNAELSPNSNMVAWTQSPNPNPSQTSVLYTKDLTNTSSKTPTVKTYTFPAGESDGNTDVGLVWSRDGKTIVLQTWTAASNTFQLRRLDLATGAFSLVTSGLSQGNLISMDVLGDNKTVVYSDGNSIRIVPSGTTTSKVVRARIPANTGSCGRVEARPTTTNEFLYTCSSASAVSVLYRQTTTGSPIAIKTIQQAYSQTVGDINTTVNDFALSPDGHNIALYLNDAVVTNSTKCEYSFSSRITTIPYYVNSYGAASYYDVAKVNSPIVTQGCKGGAQFNDLVAWSPDGQYIAYLGHNAYIPDGSLYTIPSSGYASYGAPAEFGKKIVDKNVVDVSW